MVNMEYYLTHFKPILQNVIGIIIVYKGVDTRVKYNSYIKGRLHLVHRTCSWTNRHQVFSKTKDWRDK